MNDYQSINRRSSTVLTIMSGIIDQFGDTRVRLSSVGKAPYQSGRTVVMPRSGIEKLLMLYS